MARKPTTAATADTHTDTDTLLAELSAANTKAAEEAAEQARPTVDDGIVELPAGGQKVAILRASQIAENLARRATFGATRAPRPVPTWIVYVRGEDGRLAGAYSAFSFRGPEVQPRLNLTGAVPDWIPRAIPGASLSAHDGELTAFQWCFATNGEMTVFTNPTDVALSTEAAPRVVEEQKPADFEPPPFRTEGMADALHLIYRVATAASHKPGGHATRAAELLVSLSQAIARMEAGGPPPDSPQNPCALLPWTAVYATPGLSAAVSLVLSTMHAAAPSVARHNVAYHVEELMKVLQIVDEARREDAERKLNAQVLEDNRRKLAELMA